MSTTSFAERLKALRESAHLTQPELAARAGMNRFGIAKLEQGVREPSWATVQALARALGVSILAFTDEAPADKTGRTNPAEQPPPAPREGQPPRPRTARTPARPSGKKSGSPKSRGHGKP